MEPRTHLQIDSGLCGAPTLMEPGRAEVRLTTEPRMAVDERGLVHGGFVFGLADYAAMLAVNEPNVVVAGAEVRFRRPVVAGEALVARADVEATEGRRRVVRVEVRRDAEVVFEGRLSCAVPDEHVLA